MNNKIILYLIIFVLLYFTGLNTHLFFIEKIDLQLPFDLYKIYLFHAVFSALICVNFLIFSSVDKVFEQLAFIYLGTLVLKIIVFSIFFYRLIFSGGSLTNQEAVSLLIPMFVFLLTEAVFVLKILNQKE